LDEKFMSKKPYFVCLKVVNLINVRQRLKTGNKTYNFLSMKWVISKMEKYMSLI
jgi:hypothetical protein